MIEDQADVSIARSRFYTNRAEGGGGVNSYRATMTVRDSVFRGNVATGLGALATVHLRSGRYEEASRLFSRAVAAVERANLLGADIGSAVR